MTPIPVECSPVDHEITPAKTLGKKHWIKELMPPRKRHISSGPWHHRGHTIRRRVNDLLPGLCDVTRSFNVQWQDVIHANRWSTVVHSYGISWNWEYPKLSVVYIISSWTNPISMNDLGVPGYLYPCRSRCWDDIPEIIRVFGLFGFWTGWFTMLQGAAPPALSWFWNPLTTDISTISPSYSNCKPTERYRPVAAHCGFIVDRNPAYNTTCSIQVGESCPKTWRGWRRSSKTHDMSDPICESWCWNVYLQNWAIFGWNVGK